ncbi:hypothetical protein GXP67_12875 [Rhodocytophaga rosea]|uniref:Uncharacterized protein n=1 Tax=Rhodocytophaga rosea TaxID=2704465 RepID=A0A6C0GHN4_9BACT|nr:hypothetical protein [Rhodocytophaga rosea]QHT67457.1 hypothetical protein GXP67_12875 [Rhodocytophaga rosea]
MATLLPVQAQTSNSSVSGNIIPQGKFLSDSIKVGMPVQYVLSLKHPPDMEIIFPDSSFNYAPFEWIKKEFFPTRTNLSGSTDSVIYTLATFETDTIQKLSLPVYIITSQDCTAVYTGLDSVYLQRLITTPADTLQPIADTDYFPVDLYFNYTYFLAILVGVSMLTLIVYLAFGKRISKLYKLYRMGREHSHFRNDYEKLTRNMSPDLAVQTIEHAVILWKKYMEELEDKPFSTYTTKEIAEVMPNQQLAEALQHTDRIIYGQMSTDQSIRSMRILAYIAKRSYIEKRTYLEKQKV